ncbi:restriction endonuclease subunit S [Rhodohalobacter sp. 8-1]|uniref:restriction endonuclease subunit S n=1 Tax=Rhodohalobacter sp. 8-1 TaxID=3131972 RepID=UPI0030EE8ADE
MTLSDLLDEFNVVLDTAEGLTELRSLILGLAVRGKLVSQDPNDEPASELLKKIEAEKKRLYEEGEIRKPKKFKEISEEDSPFEVPANWKWIKVGDSGITQTGTTPKKSEKKYWGEDYKFIKPANIESGEIDYNSEGVSAFAVDNGKARLIKEKSVLVVCIGTLGKTGFTTKNISCNQQINAVTPYTGIDFKYIYYVLTSNLIQSQYLDRATSTTIVILNKGNWEKTLLPLPPPSEQHRIVQKIESLFAEVDELDKKLNRQTKLDEKLQLAVNAEVQQAPDADASQSAWTFITSNFDTLYHTPEAIDDLKKNILNEAVRGRLVHQDPNGEPASELLKKIEAEKQRLYEEGEIRKPKNLPPVKEDEIPFEIPESWEWVRLAKINSVITDGEHISPEYTDKGVPMLSAKHIGENKVILKDYKFVADEDAVKFLSKCNPENGDILIVSRGGGVGRTVLNKLNTPFCLMGSVLLFKPHSDTSSKYLYYFFNTSYGFKSLINTSSHTAQQAIYISHLKEGYMVSLPPLEEQHRIVQRIEELFVICDQFKVQLEQRQAVNERLVKGLVGEVLEG